MRHINVRYFFIKDYVDKGEVSVEHCNTKNMVADLMTKPLQGKVFFNFQDSILGRSRRSGGAGAVDRILNQSAMAAAQRSTSLQA